MASGSACIRGKHRSTSLHRQRCNPLYSVNLNDIFTWLRIQAGGKTPHSKSVKRHKWSPNAIVCCTNTGGGYECICHAPLCGFLLTSFTRPCQSLSLLLLGSISLCTAGEKYIVMTQGEFQNSITGLWSDLKTHQNRGLTDRGTGAVSLPDVTDVRDASRRIWKPS